MTTVHGTPSSHQPNSPKRISKKAIHLPARNHQKSLRLSPKAANALVPEKARTLCLDVSLLLGLVAGWLKYDIVIYSAVADLSSAQEFYRIFIVMNCHELSQVFLNIWSLTDLFLGDFLGLIFFSEPLEGDLFQPYRWSAATARAGLRQWSHWIHRWILLWPRGMRKWGIRGLKIQRWICRISDWWVDYLISCLTGWLVGWLIDSSNMSKANCQSRKPSSQTTSSAKTLLPF